MTSFKKDMEFFFIPSIERMLESEITHLQYLTNAKKQFGFIEDIDQMITHSTNMRNHLQQRLNEYRDYLTKL